MKIIELKEKVIAKVWVNDEPITTNNGITWITSSEKEVEIDAIGSMYKRHYLCRLVNPDIDAPFNLKAQNGALWLPINKSRNSHLKLPVIKNLK